MATDKRMAVFDLDGTLLNSLGGIAESVNRTREDVGLPRLPLEEICEYTGDGARNLLRRSFAQSGMPKAEDELLAMMLTHYGEAPVYGTTLYPGVAEGLRRLKEAGWILAVFTNKHARIGLPILQHFGLEALFSEIIGGDSGFPLKPAPDAIGFLSEKYDVPPQHIWMVGDNHTDLDCAAAAGCHGLFCSYGFGHRREAPADVCADSFAIAIQRLLYAVGERISILSYNIDSCYGVDRECLPERSLAVIESAQADIVALQEISLHCPTRGNLDYPKMASEALFMHSAFGCSLFFNGQNSDGGMFGNAMLSALPMEQMELLHYDIPANGEPRSAIIMKVLAERPYYMAVTHLPFQGEYENDDEIRLKCLQDLHQRMLEKRYFPMILAGDLNAKPHTTPIEFLRREWCVTNDFGEGYPPTALSEKYGWVHIDYIAFYPKDAFRVVGFQRYGERGASDHYPVRAILQQIR